MELLIRGGICAICLMVYNRILMNKEIKNKLVLRVELPFMVMLAFALEIVTNSVIYRAAKYLNINIWVQEILVVVCVLAEYAVICFLTSKILKEKIIKWMYSTVSLLLTIGIGWFVIFGNITREWYIIAFWLVFLFSFVLVYVNADKINISNKNVWKNRLKFSFPVALFIAFTFYIYLPSELYLGNPNAFSVEYWKFIWPLLVQFLLFVAVYLYATLLCMSKIHYYICNIFCLLFVFMSNIQNMLLNGKLKSMDGTMQEWDVVTVVFNGVLWLIIFGACLGFSIVNKKMVRNVCKIVGYMGMTIQIVSLVIMLVVTLPTIKFDKYVLSTEDYFEVSGNENVFVFVLDWFDNQIMEDILSDDENFLRPLDGFVHYTNATSKYAFTDMSLVYLLTGVEWEYPQLEKDYAVTAHKNSDFLEQIASEDYSIGIYTESSYVGQQERNLVENGRYVERSLDKEMQKRFVDKAVRYKTCPFLFKEKFFYTDDDIYGMVLTEGNIESHSIYSDRKFAKQLLEEGITVNNDKSGMFKLYHLHGAHSPFNMDEQFERADTDRITQSRASMRVVYTFIEQLKAQGLYEDSMIIITADHGQNYFDRPKVAEEMGLELVSSPIMFVKESGSYGKELQVSVAPVSHEEVVPTIAEAIMGDIQGYGRTLKEVPNSEERMREFIYGRHSDIPFVRYEIKGNVMDLENWSEPVSYKDLSDTNS